MRGAQGARNPLGVDEQIAPLAQAFFFAGLGRSIGNLARRKCRVIGIGERTAGLRLELRELG